MQLFLDEGLDLRLALHITIEMTRRISRLCTTTLIIISTRIPHDAKYGTIMQSYVIYLDFPGGYTTIPILLNTVYFGLQRHGHKSMTLSLLITASLPYISALSLALL